MSQQEQAAQINRERYESLPAVQCPVCGRIIQWHGLLKNLAGEKVMSFHYHQHVSRGECPGSMRSPAQVRNVR